MDYKVFGCKTNKYFAEKWLVHPYLSDKSGYFIASCVVTDNAKSKWVKYAKKILPKIKIGEKLFLSGCGNIRNGVVDPRFFEVYEELSGYRDRIEILPEDPDEYSPPSEGGAGGVPVSKRNFYGQDTFYIPFRPDLTERAKELRKNMTGPEKMIWYNFLMNQKCEGYKFIRQKPILDYIVDFYCHELRLVIEIDGESHSDQKEYDIKRDAEINELGVTTLRFTNEECTKNGESVYGKILEYIRGYLLSGKTSENEQNPPTPLQRGSEKIRSLRKIAGKELYTRKYMVIQTGCDNFCTFCLTVQARGRHKWRPKEEIIEEITTFVESGGKEVVFTGINLGAWGAMSSNNYTESKFVELVETVLEKTTLERLRISSLGVEFVSDRLIDLFRNARINAYIHLSIQSGSSDILRDMHRHYDGEQVRKVLTKLRSIKRTDGTLLNIGADLIVGFPGESEEDYRMTESLVKDFEIPQLHAFPFSAHLDHYSVPAGSYDHQVPNHLIQARLKQLLQTGKSVSESFGMKNTGKKLRVLIEKVSGRSFSGWSENYLACDETNFLPDPGEELIRGGVIQGIYTRQSGKGGELGEATS